VVNTIYFRMNASNAQKHVYRIEELLLKREWAADWRAGSHADS